MCLFFYKKSTHNLKMLDKTEQNECQLFGNLEVIQLILCSDLSHTLLMHPPTIPLNLFPSYGINCPFTQVYWQQVFWFDITGSHVWESQSFG